MVVVVFNKLIYCIRLTNYMVEGIARIKAHHLSTSLGKSLRLFSRPGLHKVLSAMVDIAFKALREGDGFERLPP